MKRFEHKTAIITGGASGIGRAAAKMFAAEGANVVIATSTIVDKAQALAWELTRNYGVGAVGVKCDVRSEADVENMISVATQTFGGIDIAFNNAGVGPDGVTIPLAPLAEVTEKDWDWVMDVDCKGVFLCMKHEIRAMQSRGGCIVNTASTAGLKAMGGFGAYGPAKAGLIMLTKAAACEYRDKGIRCNVVCPGPTKGTGMSERMFGGKPESELPPDFRQPEDVAEVVLWLCSDESRHVNGNVVTADGGMDII
jgi:NAD(P)-dependent dehydrogenase (short-subunit alcohol dehydrogenase family)